MIGPAGFTMRIQKPDKYDKIARTSQATMAKKLARGETIAFYNLFIKLARIKANARVPRHAANIPLIKELLDIYDPDELQALIRAAFDDHKKFFVTYQGSRDVSWRTLYRKHQDAFDLVAKHLKRAEMRKRIDVSLEAADKQATGAIPEVLLQKMRKHKQTA